MEFKQNSLITLEQWRDPKYYLEHFCQIKGKEGGLIPFILNEAQKDLFNAIRKDSRIIILKARQMGFCLDKDTKILSDDLRWIAIKNISVGQKIIAVDEFPLKGRGQCRKMRCAVIEAKRIVYEEAFKLKMDNGIELIATAQHRFLSKKWDNCPETKWKKVEDMKIGSEIRYITKPWENGNFEDGWFGGMIDGEGYLSKKTRTGSSINISQIEGKVWDRLFAYVMSKGFSFRIEWDKRESGDSSKLGNKPVGKIVLGRMNEIFYVLGQTRPSRFINCYWWEGKDLPGKCSGIGWSKIISIESLGKREMIDVQTSKKTFIAEGFVSHNSTGISGYFYHAAITNPGTTTALISYNTNQAAELLDKIKTFWRTTPEEIRPPLERKSRYELSFPTLNSNILVLPSERAGMGYTLHFCLCTELSSWEDADEKMMTVEAAVPLSGKLAVESVPRGTGNKYHRMWMDQNNGYVKKKYGWWWGYSVAEIALIRKRYDPMYFAQHYGLEFLASGRSAFDQIIISKQRKNILEVGTEVVLPDGNKHIVYEDSDGLRIYSSAMLDRTYICGVDVSEGVAGGDYSVAVIWDRATGEEAAFYRGLIAPDILGRKLDKWGRAYNNALMVVEMNNHGFTTMNTIKNLGYSSLYFRPTKLETFGTKFSDRLGWKTTKATRFFLIDDFKEALREGSLTIRSKEIVDEMETFVFDNNNDMAAQKGFFDDGIFAAAVGFQGFKMTTKHADLDQLDYTDYWPCSSSY